jgi:hypothetical protein
MCRIKLLIVDVVASLNRNKSCAVGKPHALNGQEASQVRDISRPSLVALSCHQPWRHHTNVPWVWWGVGSSWRQILSIMTGLRISRNPV